MPGRPQPEHRGEDHRGGQRAEHTGRTPAPCLGLDEAERKGTDGEGEEDGARQVGQRAAAVGTVGGQQPDTGHEAGGADGHVDEEDPAPVGLHEQPARDGAEAGGDAPDGGPTANGARAALRRGPDEQQRERRRHEGGGACGLEGTRRDEPADAGGDGAQCGGDGEHRESQQEPPAVSVSVGEASGGHEQGREHDRVGVQDPGQGGERGVAERGGEGGHGDVDDEQVEVHHEDARGDDPAGGRTGPAGGRRARTRARPGTGGRGGARAPGRRVRHSR